MLLDPAVRLGEHGVYRRQRSGMGSRMTRLGRSPGTRLRRRITLRLNRFMFASVRHQPLHAWTGKFRANRKEGFSLAGKLIRVRPTRLQCMLFVPQESVTLANVTQEIIDLVRTKRRKPISRRIRIFRMWVWIRSSSCRSSSRSRHATTSNCTRRMPTISIPSAIWQILCSVTSRSSHERGAGNPAEVRHAGRNAGRGSTVRPWTGFREPQRARPGCPVRPDTRAGAVCCRGPGAARGTQGRPCRPGAAYLPGVCPMLLRRAVCRRDPRSAVSASAARETRRVPPQDNGHAQGGGRGHGRDRRAHPAFSGGRGRGLGPCAWVRHGVEPGRIDFRRG